MTSVCLASSLGCTVVKSQMVKMVEVDMVKMVSVEMIRVEMVKMVKVRMVMMVKVKRVNIVRLEMVKMVSVEMVKVEIINMVKLQMFKMLNMKMVKMIKVEMVDMVKMVKLVKVEGSVVSAGKGMPIPVVKLGTLAVRVVLGFLYFWRRRPPQRAGHAPPPLQVGRPAREPRIAREAELFSRPSSLTLGRPCNVLRGGEAAVPYVKTGRACREGGARRPPDLAQEVS